MKDQSVDADILLKLGFLENFWTDQGRVIYTGYEKYGVMIEARDGQFYLDGSDWQIKTVKQLRALFFGLTSKRLNA